MGAAITGWGKALPKTEVSSRDMGARLGLSEQWILERTGVRARRVAGADETSSSLATGAGRAALGRADVDATELDMVIVATATPDYQIPATAPLVTTALGASRAGAFDIAAGCGGFLYGLAVATALVDSHAAERVLLCGAEVLSRIIDYGDPKSSVLFGDGAGAVVVRRVDGAGGVGPFALRSDGSKRDLLYVPPESGVIRMEGREVYRFAVDTMSRAVAEGVASAGMTLDDVDLIVAHQANARITAAVGERLGVAPEVMFSNIERLGNTSAASIPLALCDAAGSGRLNDGDVVVLAAVGAGLVWGAGIVLWGSVPIERVAVLAGEARV